MILLINHREGMNDSPILGMEIVWFATDDKDPTLLDYRYFSSKGEIKTGRVSSATAWSWRILRVGVPGNLLMWLSDSENTEDGGTLDAV